MRNATNAEAVQQVCVSVALGLADDNREHREAYRHWIMVAQVANERTRMSMAKRGVQMRTFKNRRGTAQ